MPYAGSSEVTTIPGKRISLGVGATDSVVSEKIFKCSVSVLYPRLEMTIVEGPGST
jgi:hypothetical protein